MKNVPIPTDFSENSINAIHYAREIYKDVNCTFSYFRYMNTLFNWPRNAFLFRFKQKFNRTHFYKESEQNLKRIIHKLKKNSTHKLKAICDYNFFINSVLKMVEYIKIDTIVLGTNGVTGAKEIFFGSHTGDVI